MLIFLRRASLHSVNQSSIPTLIKRVRSGDDDPASAASTTARHARILLTFTSKHCPALYKLHVGELAKAIADSKNPVLVEVGLQALSALAKWDPKLTPADK
jgi:sister chromatid cohesion protein PDS5